MILLIVDTQKQIVTNKLYAYDQFIENVSTLIREARKHDIEVIYIRHDDGPNEELTFGKPGFEIDDHFQPIPGEKIFDKDVNSAFRDTGLLAYLQEKQETQIIIAGLQTDFCIDATVKCGFEHHFQMIVPAYANTTVNNAYMGGEETYHYYNEMMWKDRYAKCLSMEEVIAIMK